MKASVNTRYGTPDVLHLRDVPTPEPGAGEVLVRVQATTVSRTDTCALRAHPWFVRPEIGLFRPKRTILGLDFAGTVAAVGAGVADLRPGMRVFGLTPGGHGAHAEFLVMPADGAIAEMPEGLAFPKAVLCEGAWYANTYLQAFGLGPGHDVLVYGGSGAIGTAAVQLAKSCGAAVTAVTSTPHLELVRSLGADRVIDYTAQDFTQIPDRFDLVLDAVGKTTYGRCKHLLKPGGTFSATDLGPFWQNIWLALWSGVRRNRRVLMPMPVAGRPVMDVIKSRIEAGELRAVIDRTYPFDRIAEAYRYVDTGQKTGIVVIEIAAPS